MPAREKQERNRLMLQDYRYGILVKVLAKRYKLSVSRVRRILKREQAKGTTV
jgi:Mor family transcriptional regulator